MKCVWYVDKLRPRSAEQPKLTAGQRNNPAFGFSVFADAESSREYDKRFAA